jgi:hypothetical protein
MTQDISYFEIGYIDESYFVRLADAESAISTSSTMSCAGGVIKQGQIAVTGAFNTNLVANPIRNDQSILTVTTTLEATPKRIRDNNIAVSSAFSIATSGSRIRYINAQEDAAFTVSIGNSRVRNNQAAVTAAFSSTLTVRETSGLAANLTTTSTLEATAIRAIRIIGDSTVQGQIISPTGAIVQTDIYPNYAKVTLALPA